MKPSEHSKAITTADAAIRHWVSSPAILAGLIGVLAFGMYIPTVGFEFVWDDGIQVLTNPLVISWRMIPRAFESNLWFKISHTSVYYRPFFIVWSILNHALFGFDPRGWHFMNVSLHVMASCLVFVLLRKLKADYWAAALAAVFFAIHPAHIEPVAWISAGSDSLVMILLVLTFLLYLKAKEPARKHRAGLILTSGITFGFALLTKEMAVTFPAIVLLYEWIVPRDGAAGQGHASRLRTLLAAAPYALLDIAYLLQRRHVVKSIVPSAGRGITLPVALKTIPIVLLHYLGILVWPTGLNAFYYEAPVNSILSPRFLLPAVAVSGIAGLIWWWAKRERDPLILFFGFWLFICLAPALYLPTLVIGDFVRDRYLYLPSIGFAFLLARALQGARSRWTVIDLPVLRYGLPAGLALLLVIATFAQESYWTNDVVVFSRGYSLSPQNAMVAELLAEALERVGRPEKAAPLLQEVIRKEPNNSGATFSLAIADWRLGQMADAKKELARAVALAPEYYSETSAGLGNIGIAFLTFRQYSDAEISLRKALRLEPDDIVAHFYLGLLLLRTERAVEGEQQIREALSINPTGRNLHWALGLSREQQGDTEAASHEFSEELRLYPDNKEALVSAQQLAESSHAPDQPNPGLHLNKVGP